MNNNLCTDKEYWPICGKSERNIHSDFIEANKSYGRISASSSPLKPNLSRRKTFHVGSIIM